MNLREGTRRLALLLGAAGAIACGFVSYAQLQSTLRQRTDHKRFEQLANSGVVKEQRKTLQSPDPYAPYASIAQPIPQHGRAKLSDTKPVTQPTDQQDAQPNDRQTVTPASGVQLDWSKSVPLPSQVNEGKIATINWSHDYGVASIETQDGQTLYPTPEPGAWSYVLIAILPLLGFFIPWSAVRAIGWVGAGFVQPAR